MRPSPVLSCFRAGSDPTRRPRQRSAPGCLALGEAHEELADVTRQTLDGDDPVALQMEEQGDDEESPIVAADTRVAMVPRSGPHAEQRGLSGQVRRLYSARPKGVKGGPGRPEREGVGAPGPRKAWGELSCERAVSLLPSTHESRRAALGAVPAVPV